MYSKIRKTFCGCLVLVLNSALVVAQSAPAGIDSAKKPSPDRIHWGNGWFDLQKEPLLKKTPIAVLHNDGRLITAEDFLIRKIKGDSFEWSAWERQDIAEIGPVYDFAIGSPIINLNTGEVVGTLTHHIHAPFRAGIAGLFVHSYSLFKAASSQALIRRNLILQGGGHNDTAAGRIAECTELLGSS